MERSLIESLDREIREATAELPDRVTVRTHLTGVDLTTFGVGGRAERLVEVSSVRAAENLLARLTAISPEVSSVPRYLGAGSNLVFPDAGVELPILTLGRALKGYRFLSGRTPSLDELRSFGEEIDEHSETGIVAHRVLAFGGCSLMALSRKLSQAGLSGLEFAAGIPGTVGGAMRMNAGAHGHSFGEIVESVFFLSPQGTLQCLSRAELSYSYRHSSVPQGALILACELLLTPGDPAEVAKTRQSCLDYRRRTQPLQYPSAGSVFRNPPPESDERRSAGVILAAGALLERAGLKGRQRGGIMYSDIHANWLIRFLETGTAADVQLLVDEGQRAVLEQTGISLEPEIVFW